MDAFERPLRWIFVCGLMLAMLAGCGGGGGGGGGGNAAVTHVHFVVVNSDVSGIPNQPSVSTFDEGDSGNTAPELTLSGGATGLDGGASLGVELANSTLYVANTASATITAYSTTNGNMAPKATIAGANTGLMRPAGLLRR